MNPNGTRATRQLWGAISGDFNASESMEQEGDIVANAIVGFPALWATGNPKLAQTWANNTGLVVATGDFMNAPSVKSGLDMAMGAIGTFGTGCTE